MFVHFIYLHTNKIDDIIDYCSINNIKKILYIILFGFLLFYIYLNQNKIIVVIFAGRKKYLQIILVYLQYLKYNKKISEIHFWQFTNNKLDEDYLNSLSNLHKTNGKFSYYRNIYPIIYNNNYFIININFIKYGAFILINDKYEIFFNFDDNISVYLNISGVFHYKKQSKVFKKIKFLKYIIRIVNNYLIIEDEIDILIKIMIDDNNFNSIKIKSQENGETIWDYKESINKNVKLYDTLFRENWYWYEAYKFYLDYNFNILIKIDDDICFIDISRFQEFLNFIQSFKKNLTIPNLVNHAVSLYYNNKENIIPNSVIKKRFRNRNSSVELYNYYKDGKGGIKMHKYFLKNIHKFTKNNMKPIKLNGQKPSICMFGITKESYNYVYNPKVVFNKSNIPEKYIFEDEKYAYSLSNNYLFPRFVCLHYAFGPQREAGLEEYFLDYYRNISLKYTLNL